MCCIFCEDDESACGQCARTNWPPRNPWDIFLYCIFAVFMCLTPPMFFVSIPFIILYLLGSIEAAKAKKDERGKEIKRYDAAVAAWTGGGADAYATRWAAISESPGLPSVTVTRAAAGAATAHSGLSIATTGAIAAGPVLDDAGLDYARFDRGAVLTTTVEGFHSASRDTEEDEASFVVANPTGDDVYEVKARPRECVIVEKTLTKEERNERERPYYARYRFLERVEAAESAANADAASFSGFARFGLETASDPDFHCAAAYGPWRQTGVLKRTVDGYTGTTGGSWLNGGDDWVAVPTTCDKIVPADVPSDFFRGAGDAAVPFTIRSFRDPFVVAGRETGCSFYFGQSAASHAAEARNYCAGAFACLAALLFLLASASGALGVVTRAYRKVFCGSDRDVDPWCLETREDGYEEEGCCDGPGSPLDDIEPAGMQTAQGAITPRAARLLAVAHGGDPRSAEDGEFRERGIWVDGFQGFGRGGHSHHPGNSPGNSWPPRIAMMPHELLGVWDCGIKWNGVTQLHVGVHGLVWKGVRVLARETALDFIPSGMRVRFSAYVPDCTSAWARGAVGLTESFDVTFTRGQRASKSRFEGIFRRQHEGPLEVKLRRNRREATNLADVAFARMPPPPVVDFAAGRLVAPQLAAPDEVAVDMNDDDDAEKKPELAMRALDKQASGPVALGILGGEEEACPVCFSSWREPGVVKATTKCGHDFCAKCVVSVLAITPPAASGSCPLCRADVTLADITMELPTV